MTESNQDDTQRTASPVSPESEAKETCTDAEALELQAFYRATCGDTAAEDWKAVYRRVLKAAGVERLRADNAQLIAMLDKTGDTSWKTYLGMRDQKERALVRAEDAEEKMRAAEKEAERLRAFEKTVDEIREVVMPNAMAVGDLVKAVERLRADAALVQEVRQELGKHNLAPGPRALEALVQRAEGAEKELAEQKARADEMERLLDELMVAIKKARPESEAKRRRFSELEAGLAKEKARADRAEARVSNLEFNRDNFRARWEGAKDRIAKLEKAMRSALGLIGDRSPGTFAGEAAGRLRAALDATKPTDSGDGTGPITSPPERRPPLDGDAVGPSAVAPMRHSGHLTDLTRIAHELAQRTPVSPDGQAALLRLLEAFPAARDPLPAPRLEQSP